MRHAHPVSAASSSPPSGSPEASQARAFVKRAMASAGAALTADMLVDAFNEAFDTPAVDQSALLEWLMDLHQELSTAAALEAAAARKEADEREARALARLALPSPVVQHQELAQSLTVARV